MKRIGLLSDTHYHIDDNINTFFSDCDEIWHAGDIGNMKVIEALEQIAPVRAVFGNIDNDRLRQSFKEHLRFTIEDTDVWMTHIGGYPGKYDRRVKPKIFTNSPDIFISGHSHILKVMFDKKLNLLHINPGAYGKLGYHKVRTAVRFQLNKGRAEKLEVYELKR